jgi:hypothetical protein
MYMRINVGGVYGSAPALAPRLSGLDRHVRVGEME